MSLQAPEARYERDMSRDELFVLWSAARAEANIAYDDWCAERSRDAYLVYRAAEDRADAAEVALGAGPPEPAFA